MTLKERWQSRIFLIVQLLNVNGSRSAYAFSSTNSFLLLAALDCFHLFSVMRNPIIKTTLICKLINSQLGWLKMVTNYYFFTNILTCTRFCGEQINIVSVFVFHLACTSFFFNVHWYQRQQTLQESRLYLCVRYTFQMISTKSSCSHNIYKIRFHNRTHFGKEFRYL